MSYEKLATAVPIIGTPALTACWEWMKAPGVSSKQEAEELAASFVKDDRPTDVTLCTEELRGVEEKFDGLATMIDFIIQKKEVEVSKYGHYT